jgi:MrfA Zn-binding domain
MASRPKRRGTTTAPPPKPDGQIRQSQLVTTFGPGAMVDLVDRAIVIGGLDHWTWADGKWITLDDPRLRRSLLPRLRALDPNLDLAPTDYFRKAPEGDLRNPSPAAGVRALEFPKWFVCQDCNRLARAADQFELHRGRYRHQCQGNRMSRVVPVRFVATCPRGHLLDFPWNLFVHRDAKDGICDRPVLQLKEGATGDLARIRVRCENCGASQPMSAARAPVYPCSGDRPWLGGRAANETCGESLELLVRTASNAYFSQVVSAIRLPPVEESPLNRRVREPGVWKLVENVTNSSELQLLMKLQAPVGAAFKGYAVDDVVAAISAVRSHRADDSERPLRTVEFERIVSAPDEQPGNEPEVGCQFAAFRIPADRITLPPGVRGLIVIPEMREIRVQVSFSRLDSISSNLQGEYDFDRIQQKPAPLMLPTGNQKWLPAAEVRGEGIFIELDEAAVEAWENRPAVVQRSHLLKRAYDQERRGEFPGIRFYLLHTLSHLLLTAISLECGYAASAIRERIYSKAGAWVGDPAMAAVLLSTGTTGTEGTLGGLVEEGRHIDHHLREAWDLGRLCSNDPVCAVHNPEHSSSDRRSEGAACHGCLYIAECSCEWQNRFLDRALLVPTIGNDKELAFFQDRP